MSLGAADTSVCATPGFYNSFTPSRFNHSAARATLQAISPMAFQSIYAGPCTERAQDGALWKALGWAERAGAVALLVAFSPVLIVTGVVIAAISRRPPLVAHQRMGLGGRPFWTLKFRSMWPV